MPAPRSGIASVLATLLLVGILLVVPTAPSSALEATAPTVAAEPAAPQGACTDLLVVSVRGSGESVSESLTNAVRDAVLAGVGDDRTVTSESLPYTAAAMDVLGADFQHLVDFGWPLTSDWDYFASVNDGAAALLDRLLDAEADCPDQKWVLIGYSQGSMVISQVLQYFLDPERFAGIALVANPSRQSSDEQTNLGTARVGNGLNFWVPGDLGYGALPRELASVTTDLCNTEDLVCDSTHTFQDLALAAPGLPWVAPLGLPLAIEHGLSVHTTYDPAALAALAQPSVQRALTFAVPKHATTTVLVCGAAGTVTGTAEIKPLTATSAGAQAWRLNQTLLGGTLSGAVFTARGFTKGTYWLNVDERGVLTGALPAGRWELDVTVTTGLEPARTIHLVVRVITSGTCGAVTGYITDRDGEPVKDVEVWLEKTTLNWDGESDRRLAMNRTDTHGYFSIAGAYSGNFLLYFTDGPAAASAQEGAAEGYLDYFDQYYSTAATARDSDLPERGSVVALGSGVTRIDQALQQSATQVMHMRDAATGAPLAGIHATGYHWDATTGTDGALWHAGRFTYLGCLSYYDPAQVYVERGWYFLDWPGEDSVRMYRGSSISGTVTDAAGKPLANAEVSYDRDTLPTWPVYDFGGGSGCYGQLGLTDAGRTFTDANGHYRLGALYGGENYRVYAANVRSQAVSLPTARNGYADVVIDVRGAPLTLTTATPTIKGTVRAGQTLSATPGAWTSGTTFTYQWLVAGKAVPGATKKTFLLTTTSVGNTVTVKVTGAKSGYTTASTTSKATAAVAPGSVLRKSTRPFGGTGGR